jgi:hypothetical protein
MIGRSKPRPARAVFRSQQIVDKLEYLADIATDSDLIGGAVLEDRPTGICRLLKWLT